MLDCLCILGTILIMVICSLNLLLDLICEYFIFEFRLLFYPVPLAHGSVSLCSIRVLRAL